MSPLQVVLIYVAVVWGWSLLYTGLPALVAADKLMVEKRWWFLVPVGDLIGLGRCAGASGWNTVWPSLLLWGFPIGAAVALGALGDSIRVPTFAFGILPILVQASVWGSTAQELALSGRWGRLAAVPVLGLVGIWTIVLRGHPLEDEDKASRSGQAVPGRAQGSSSRTLRRRAVPALAAKPETGGAHTGVSQASPLCIHHWVLTAPQGELTRGRCAKCGKEKEFSAEFVCTLPPRRQQQFGAGGDPSRSASRRTSRGARRGRHADVSETTNTPGPFQTGLKTQDEPVRRIRDAVDAAIREAESEGDGLPRLP